MAKKKKGGKKGNKGGGNDGIGTQVVLPKKGFPDLVGDNSFGPPGWSHRMSTYEMNEVPSEKIKDKPKNVADSEANEEVHFVCKLKQTQPHATLTIEDKLTIPDVELNHQFMIVKDVKIRSESGDFTEAALSNIQKGMRVVSINTGTEDVAVSNAEEASAALFICRSKGMHECKISLRPSVKRIKTVVLDGTVKKLPFSVPCIDVTHKVPPHDPALGSSISREVNAQSGLEFVDTVNRILIRPEQIARRKTGEKHGEIESQISSGSGASIISPALNQNKMHRRKRFPASEETTTTNNSKNLSKWDTNGGQLPRVFYASDEGRPVAVERCIWANDNWKGSMSTDRRSNDAAALPDWHIYRPVSSAIADMRCNAGKTIYSDGIQGLDNFRKVDIYSSGVRPHSATAVPGTILPDPGQYLSPKQFKMGKELGGHNKDEDLTKHVRRQVKEQTDSLVFTTLLRSSTSSEVSDNSCLTSLAATGSDLATSMRSTLSSSDKSAPAKSLFSPARSTTNSLDFSNTTMLSTSFRKAGFVSMADLIKTPRISMSTVRLNQMIENYSRVILRMKRHATEVSEVYIRRSALYATLELYEDAHTDALRAIELWLVVSSVFAIKTIELTFFYVCLNTLFAAKRGLKQVQKTLVRRDQLLAKQLSLGLGLQNMGLVIWQVRMRKEMNIISEHVVHFDVVYRSSQQTRNYGMQLKWLLVLLQGLSAAKARKKMMKLI